MGAIRRQRLQEHHWRRVSRDEALIKQGGRCKYCKRSLKRGTATADHVVPISTLRCEAKTNIVAACYDCNQAKRSVPARSFIRMLKGLEKPVHYNVAVQGVLYRIEKRAGQAVANILAVVGERP